MPASRTGSHPSNVVVDVVAEAIGQSRRENPTAPVTGGPAGNARLTAWTGLLLLVLSLAELVTLLDVRGLISWHIFIGTLLLPPALLKTGSTGWRIARYYTGNPAYRTAGPPPLLLRILGPAVVASTLGLLVSGIALIVIGPAHSRTVLFSARGQQVDAVTIHKIVFVIWAAVTGLHVLGRLVPALNLTAGRATPGVEISGRSSRGGMVIGSLAAGIVAAALLLAASGDWVSLPRYHG
jgi:hypothetical protein